MTTLQDAKRAWKQATNEQFKKKTPIRTLYLGKGTGTTTDDMYVSGSPNYFYARPSLSNSNWVIVKNTGGIGAPVFNLPVRTGFTDIDQKDEQILGIDQQALSWQYNTSGIGGAAGVHAAQHGINGADTLFVDPRMIVAGLPRPVYNAPSGSLQVYVSPVSYMYDKLYIFSGASTGNLYDYVPPVGGVRYVTIAIDAKTAQLVVRPGAVQFPSTVSLPTTPEEWLEYDFNAPSGEGTLLVPQDPGGEELPLAAIYLTSDTNYLEWRDDQANQKNMFDVRPFLSPPVGRLVNFMNDSGASSTLPQTGAQDATLPYIKGSVTEGHLYLGEHTPDEYGFGKRIYFRGVEAGTDDVWMAKYTDTYDLTLFRVHVGDNPSQKDGFQLGTSPSIWSKLFIPYFSAYSTGVFVFGDPGVENVGLNVEGDIFLTGVVNSPENAINNITSVVDTTLGETDQFNLVNTTVEINVFLPAVSLFPTPTHAQRYTIKNHFDSAEIVLAPNSIDAGVVTIEGVSEVNLLPGDSVVVFTDGIDWHII